MNIDVDLNSPVFEYYDSDYPSKDNNPIPENFDATTVYQGLAYDTGRYIEIAKETGGPILELCCGTGRVTIPMAQAGFDITGVDLSPYFLKQCEGKVAKADGDISKRINLVEQDITNLDLDEKQFKMAYIAFNSLICLPYFDLQCLALKAIRKHLAPSGVLVIDIINPLGLNFQGDNTPKLFYTRKNIHNGNCYSRFAMMGPLDENQRQELHGWYDEIDSKGIVNRKYYTQYWRPAFRYEIELMLKESGFSIKTIEGGHKKEAYTSQSPRMFIQAIAE